MIGEKMNTKMLVRAALTRIRNSSSFYEGGWRSPEAALLWAIYEQAALDHFLKNENRHRLSDTELRTAQCTSETGIIFMPSGRKQNILEILQVDPQWALRQIKAAIACVERIAA